MTRQSTGLDQAQDRASAEQHTFLRIYLEDHLAGAAAGSRRARRLADAERDSESGPELVALADAIDADRRALVELVRSLDVEPRPYKRWLARLGEWVGLVKLNGRLVRRSPLSTLVETEALLIGVRGKLAGWQTLRRTLGTSPTPSVDLDELVARAQTQLDGLDALHTRAADQALGTDPPHRSSS